ncbi:hypothetical protein [Fretibacterium fastidiosum]|nr:hypothetical protein [Fretibacterium fastidiosum]
MNRNGGLLVPLLLWLCRVAEWLLMLLFVVGLCRMALIFSPP